MWRWAKCGINRKKCKPIFATTQFHRIIWEWSEWKSETSFHTQTSRAEAFRCRPVGSARTLSNGMMSGSDFLRWLTAPMSSGVRVAAASAAMELPWTRDAVAVLRRRPTAEVDTDLTPPSPLEHLPDDDRGISPTIDRRRWYDERTAGGGPGPGPWDVETSPWDAGLTPGDDGCESDVIKHWMLWRREHAILPVRSLSQGYTARSRCIAPPENPSETYKTSPVI